MHTRFIEERPSTHPTALRAALSIRRWQHDIRNYADHLLFTQFLDVVMHASTEDFFLYGNFCNIKQGGKDNKNGLELARKERKRMGRKQARDH
mmetsp:Transcript_32223/g.63952  ORF Transcript_32223/g.63952 Transcript_32223/m.63952 type:complete len:93 (-) Transcript_32223:535-813(-)